MSKLTEPSSRLAASASAALLAFVAIVTWWSNFRGTVIRAPLDGWSAIDWVNHQILPDHFDKDFPNGIENYAKSLVMHIYPMALRLLGVDPEKLLPVFIGMEVLVFSAGLYLLVRALFPNVRHASLVVIATIGLAGTVRTLDLAQFGGPHFVGLYYGVGDGLRMTAIAFLLRKRYVAAGVTLGLTTSVHLTLGLTTAFFAALMYLANPDTLKKRGPWFAALAFVLVAGAWLGIAFRDVAPTVSAIQADQWVNLTQMFSFHWYPVANEMFDVRRHDAFVPLLSYALLLFYYLTFTDLDRTTVSQLRAAFVGMICLTVAGVLFSSAIPEPTLIRLALHRASDALLLLGMPLVLVGLIRDLSSGNLWRAALAGAIIVSPLMSPPGFPIALSLLLIVHAYRAQRLDFEWRRSDFALGCAALAVCVYLVVAEISWGAAPLQSFIGNHFAIAAAAGTAAGKWAWRAHASIRTPLLVAALVAIAGMGVIRLESKRNEVRSEASRDYRAAQDWARMQTPPNAVFMVDPTIYYGWRDFSQRSSFGNLREWLHTSWLYNPRPDRLVEGLRRLQEFGLRPEPYFGHRPAILGFLEVDRALKERFYSASDSTLEQLAKRNAIDFIVARKSEERSRRTLPLMYENNSYVIYKATSEVEGRQ